MLGAALCAEQSSHVGMKQLGSQLHSLRNKYCQKLILKLEHNFVVEVNITSTAVMTWKHSIVLH